VEYVNRISPQAPGYSLKVWRTPTPSS
jgi:hypothetical protein